MNLTIVIKSYINPDKVPDFFGIKPFVVTTTSMEPEINGGDLVITKTIDPAELKEGDIISFKDGDSIVTHKIIKLTEKDGEPVFVTKGVANNAEDENRVRYSQVESIYLFKISGLGHFSMFMQTPQGVLVFVGIPLCGFLIYDVVRRLLNDRREKEKDNKMKAEIRRLREELAQKEEEQD